MNSKHLISVCCLFLLFTVLTGCKNEPANVAISRDGAKVSFSQAGKGKPALIFIHGWANKASIWDETVAHFSEKYKTIAVDLYSSDESYKNRNDWSMGLFAEDVAAVINELKLKQVVLIGFSMGSAVVVETARLLPENVIGLVIVDALKDVEMKLPPEIIALTDSFMMDLITNPTNEKLVNGGFYKKNQEESFRKVSEMLENSSQTGWKESISGFFKWINEDCTTSLQKLKIPVTSINSDMEPTETETFRKYVPSFQAKIIPDVGHVIFWDNPDEFNRLLEETIQEFLASSASK